MCCLLQEKDKGGKDKDKDKSDDLGEASNICRPFQIISYMLDQENQVYAENMINFFESNIDWYNPLCSALLTLWTIG